MSSKSKWFTPVVPMVDSTDSEQKSHQEYNESHEILKKSKLTDLDDCIITSCNLDDPNPSNWIKKFAPQTIADLAVHPKKIEEVQDWFIRNCEKNKYKNPILLLNGPSGVGKTATIKLIAQHLKYELNEWITPMDIDLMRNYNNVYDENEEFTYRESQIEKFQNFLFKGSRYTSIFDSNIQKCLLVKDFPNYLIKYPDKFNEILERFSGYGKTPLVFITTDTKSRLLNIGYNLFPDHIKNQYKITQISFNQISTTLMKKGLKRICSIMSQPAYSKYFTQPSQDVIDGIIVASQGDIRSGVLNLHFASQKNATKMKLELNTSISSSKKSSLKHKNLKFKSIGCDENITLMHALGRVLNPKYSTELSKEQHKCLTHSPEDLTDSFLSQPKNFISFLHSNYLDHFDKIENVSDVANILCQSDQFFNEYRDEALANFGLNIGIRGMMVMNENPLSGWKPIRKIRKIGEFRPLEEQAKYKLDFAIATDILALDYRTYAKIINLK